MRYPVSTCLFLALLGIIGFGFVLVAGCALPSFPMKVTVEPSPAVFNDSGCRVRVESIAFSPDVRLGEKSEAEFIDKLTPEQRQSYAADKSDMATRYLEVVRQNEHDYVKSHGHVSVGDRGDEPLVVRSKVVLFDPGSGHMVAQHALIDSAKQQTIGEFSVESQIGSWYGSGFRLRLATIAQAVTVLKYFADRFQCGG